MSTSISIHERVKIIQKHGWGKQTEKEILLAPSDLDHAIICGGLKHTVHTWHRPINHKRQLLNEMSSLIGEEAKEQLQRTEEGRGNGKDWSNETEKK